MAEARIALPGWMRAIPGVARHWTAVAALAGLTGCADATRDLGTDAGALGVGTVVGAATGNPVVGLAAGIGVRLAADEAYKYGERRYYGGLQAAIATAGGAAAEGELVAWRFDGPLGIGDTGGRVEVVRAFGTHLRCKELIFSVEPRPDDDNGDGDGAGKPEGQTTTPSSAVDLGEGLPPDSEVFTATICQGADGWAWAGSRPSTGRWGGLQ